MKRFFALIAILSSMFLIYAEDLSIKAYYHPNNMSGAKFISVDILEEDGNGTFTQKVYQTATINHVNTGTEGSNNAKTVFVVRITGNFTGKVSLTFTTGPLQAQYQGMYYIPEHRFSLYKSNNDFVRIAEFNKDKGPAAGDYPYPNASDGTKNTPVKSNASKLKNIAVTSTNRSVCTLEYPVKLTIVESTKSAGEFNYYSNITLEVEAEETV